MFFFLYFKGWILFQIKSQYEYTQIRHEHTISI